jgi:predicted nucleic acid-binding protein
VSGERSLYLDSSALVKLVLRERESTALRDVLAAASSRVSCTLARVEVVRAVREKGPRVVATARRVLEGVELIELDDGLLELASDLPEPIRSLDAIHVAAAMELGEELDAIVTYDVQMARAAEALGLPVIAPF